MFRLVVKRDEEEIAVTDLNPGIHLIGSEEMAVPVETDQFNLTIHFGCMVGDTRCVYTDLLGDNPISAWQVIGITLPTVQFSISDPELTKGKSFLEVWDEKSDTWYIVDYAE